MTPTERASFDFQRPVADPLPNPYPDGKTAQIASQGPSEAIHEARPSPPAYDVCPHCKQETEVYVVFCDGHTFEAHRCRRHGDVVPMRSAVHNESQP